MKKAPKSVLLCRTDSIGDVVLTLPLAGAIKRHFPETKIYFLGVSYTKDVVCLSRNVDEFLNWSEIKNLRPDKQIEFFKLKNIECAVHVFPNKDLSKLLKAAKIPVRVGTTNRLFHWWTCTKVVPFSRKKSSLHESQLNFKLIRFLGISVPALSEISALYGLSVLTQESEPLSHYIDKTKINLVLHPKSKGSAREWGIENFSRLISLLPKERVKIFIGGSKEEGNLIESLLKNHPEVINLCGVFSLKEYIHFISICDVFVAASTGPLHIAAALNIKALGVFAPMKPIHPGRWAPVGLFAKSFVLHKECNDCKHTMKCACILAISPIEIAKNILE